MGWQRFLGLPAQAASTTTSNGGPGRGVDETADTETVRRIVGRLEAMPRDEARFLASSGRQSFASLRSGHPIQLPPPSKEWERELTDAVGRRFGTSDLRPHRPQSGLDFQGFGRSDDVGRWNPSLF